MGGSIRPPPQSYGGEPDKSRLRDEYLSAEPDKLYVPELPRPREVIAREE